MAMTFAANSYVNIDGAWTNLTVCTVTFWVFLNALNASANRFMGSADEWEIRATNDWLGGWRFANEFYSSTLTAPPPAISTTVPALSTWYHIAGTVNSSKFSQIYVNGVLEGSGTGADSPGGTTLSIGNRSGAAANQCTNGILDDMRIYNRVLSADEILTIYSCKGTDTIVNGLQNRWLLNEGADGATASGAGIIKDLNGLQNGTPVNSPTWTASRLKRLRNYGS